MSSENIAERFQAGDSVVFVRANGLMNVLQRRNGLHRIITREVAQALNWPLTNGFIAAQRELDLVRRLAEAVPLIDTMEFVDVKVKS